MNTPTGDYSSNRIQEFAAEAARRSRLPPAQADEGRSELESHLHEAARARGGSDSYTASDAEAAILSLGSPAEVDAAFFAPLRRATNKPLRILPTPSQPGPAARNNWGPRVGAALIDYTTIIVAGLLLMLPIQMVSCVGLPSEACDIEISFFPIQMARNNQRPGGDDLRDEVQAADMRADALGWFSTLFALLVPVAYFGYAESRWGTTLGKRCFRLEVIASDGRRPDLWTSVGRNASKAILQFPFVLLLLVVDVLVGRFLGHGDDRILATWTNTRVARSETIAVTSKS